MNSLTPTPPIAAIPPTPKPAVVSMNPTKPLVKTLLVSIVALLGPFVLSLAANPTGGLANALVTHPIYAEVWGFGAYLLHNYIDQVTQGG